jgi:hypothetical protein
LRKLDPRAHIGYLVGYDSTNIYRVWIPEKGKVISTRDVIFDESTVFEGKNEPRRLDIAERDDLITMIKLPQEQTENEKLLEEVDDVFESNLVVAMPYEGGIHRGIWAGHYFDITTLARHEQDTKEKEWKDVSEEVAKEIASIWESEYRSNWRQIIVGRNRRQHRPRKAAQFL